MQVRPMRYCRCLTRFCLHQQTFYFQLVPMLTVAEGVSSLDSIPEPGLITVVPPLRRHLEIGPSQARRVHPDRWEQLVARRALLVPLWRVEHETAVRQPDRIGLDRPE